MKNKAAFLKSREFEILGSRGQRLAAFSRNAWNLNFNMMSVCQDKDFI
jgi:hypothetical protein